MENEKNELIYRFIYNYNKIRLKNRNKIAKDKKKWIYICNKAMDL